MSLHAEISDLRLDLERSVGQVEVELAQRYALRFPPRERMSLYRRFRVALGRELRRLGLRRTPPPEPWIPVLNHVDRADDARTLLIWAVGSDRETLRAACRGFQTLYAGLPGFAPVLVTDVADFAFFSRLGWLVEYVPTLSSPAVGYAERKRRYLAWRYRDAAVLPASAGLSAGMKLEELLLDRP